MIKRETVEKVLDAANIVDVVSDFVTLKKAGVNLKGLCPFHNDTTPSFMVSPSKNLCKCFSCGEGGSPVNFIMMHENLTYPEAVKYLAKKYGIEIEESVPTATEQAEYHKRESMWIANDNMAKEYNRQLLSHKKAQEYAYKRWGEDYCKLVGIGYCPLNARLVEKAGVSKEISEELHLQNKHGYDFFVCHRHHPFSLCSMVFTSFSFPACSAGAICGLAATLPPPRLAWPCSRRCAI